MDNNILCATCTTYFWRFGRNSNGKTVYPSLHCHNMWNGFGYFTQKVYFGIHILNFGNRILITIFHSNSITQELKNEIVCVLTCAFRIINVVCHRQIFASFILSVFNILVILTSSHLGNKYMHLYSCPFVSYKLLCSTYKSVIVN